mmetsp:Transcript_29816/g.79623  ORF Transcript_29816/g.79623 Transcript_29816/m.79623 type:complete len:312 (-) Transcript_29816:119-1054(-)
MAESSWCPVPTVVLMAVGVAGLVPEAANKLVDVMVPFYTMTVVAMIAATYLQEKQEKESPPLAVDYSGGGSDGGDGSGSGGVAKVVAPPLTEPKSKLSMPGTLHITLPSGEACELRSLGLGLRVKKVGPITAKVYALGVYVGTAAQTQLEQFKGKASAGAQEMFAAMLTGPDAPDVFFPRILQFVYARSVTQKQVVDAQEEALKGKVGDDVLGEMCAAICKGMGPKTAIGDTLSLVWIEPDLLRVYCSKVGTPGPGQAHGDIRDAKLVALLFKGFLGMEPRIDELKANMAAGLERLWIGGPHTSGDEEKAE